MAAPRKLKLYLFIITTSGMIGLLELIVHFQILKDPRQIDHYKDQIQKNVTEKPPVGSTAKPPTVLVTTKPPVVNPLHRYWKTNCSALFSGDKNTIHETTKMIADGRKTGKGALPVPTDREVGNWTLDCSLYKRLRRYPHKPWSSEEANYPLAYVIVAHKEAAQVERLLRAIYQPQNIICIHPDAKSPPDFQHAIRSLARCFDNVFVPSKVETVRYAGFTRLQADINCMIDLTGSIGVKYQWKYLMNLCGQDFPLKTNLEIIRQLKAYKGHNDINGVIPPSYIRRRTEFKWPAPHNMTVFFGNAYIAATRNYVEYAVHNRVGIDLLHWVNGTHSPDETFWVTLNRAKGTPGGYQIGNWETNIRFLRWGDVPNSPACVGKYVRALCVFAVGYLRHLAVQPHLFANKFHYNYDPVTLQCLEEALNNRTMRPQESDRLVNFPVTKFSWQNQIAAP